jgi:hypothetical protein
MIRLTSHLRPGEEQEDEEGRAVLDEVGDRRRQSRREPDRRVGNLIPGNEHSEPNRGHAVEEVAEWATRRRRSVEEEATEPLSLVVLERNRRVDPRVVPDAEPYVPFIELVVEVARDTQRLVGLLELCRAEELNELQPLRRRAPGAEAKRVADRAPASRTSVPSCLPPAKRNRAGTFSETGRVYPA